MDLGRWFMVHGPGSVGSTAKAMAKSYSIIKAANPAASDEELLQLTLASRYPSGRLEEAAAASMVEAAAGSLVELTRLVIHLENSRADTVMQNAPDVYDEMLDIIVQVTAKFAPSA